MMRLKLLFYAHPLYCETDRTNIPQINGATGGAELCIDMHHIDIILFCPTSRSLFL